ncbi:MAG: hypothetical protein J5824_06375 [Lachnospiraceae bacterium]|nr:hypothetical protein [Lachnospiraceae bacterium]
MSDLDKIIPGDKKEGSTVEVIVKNEHANEETEIDLVRVFENMGRKRRIYAWVMIVCMLIGIAAPLLMAELSEKTASASAVISFLYPGASRQLAPDGTELDMNTIVSSYVLRNALNKTKLSEYVPINAVENNISIENLLSADTRQKLEVMEKIADEGKNYEEVLNLDYTYDGRYIITLKNGFSADPESRNKTYLNGNELTELLNNIISAYNQYFYDTYLDFKLPDNTTAYYASESLDYIERLDNMVELLNTLSRYCTDKNKAQYIDVRSSSDGMSLADINDCIRLVKDIDVDYLYSYVYFNSISKNPASMMTKFSYLLRTAQSSLDLINDNIEDNAALIKDYKNDKIVVSASDQGTSQISSTVTDYYNGLITDQANYYSEKAELNEKIANLNDKITGFSAGNTTESQHLYVKGELSNLTRICNTLYDLVDRHASDIIDSEFYRNSYFDYIGAQYISESFFNSGTIKKVVIGAVAGLFVGFAIWGIDGLAAEIKRGSKKNEKEEEGGLA